MKTDNNCPVTWQFLYIEQLGEKKNSLLGQWRKKFVILTDGFINVEVFKFVRDTGTDKIYSSMKIVWEMKMFCSLSSCGALTLLQKSCSDFHLDAVAPSNLPGQR